MTWLMNTMWFKNFQLFHIDDTFETSVEELETRMQEMAFRPCASILPMSIGWVAPIGQQEDSPLIHQVDGLMLIALNIEDKILPNVVIKEALVSRVEELEQEQARKLSSKEKLALKDDIYATLLPKAFSKNQRIYAILDLAKRRLIIDTASRNKAEDFIAFLRKTLDSFPTALPDIIHPSALMTKWLKAAQLPKNLEFADACVLYDSKVDGGTVRCSKHDLLSPNIIAFLNDGMEVIQLQMQWKEHLRFQLRDDFSMTSVKFSDQVQDLVRDIHTETPEQEMDANFVIMSKTINEFLDEFIPLFLKRQ